MNKKLLSILLIGLLAVSLLAGCTAQGSTKTVGTAPDGNEVNIETAALKLIKAQDDGGYNLVSSEELKAWIDEGKNMIVIDTMPKDFYDKGHVPGAVNAELPKTALADATAEQKEAFAKLLGEDKDKVIVIYCGFTACARSHAGATYAKELGYTNVYRYPGGIVAWQDAQYPVEK